MITVDGGALSLGSGAAWMMPAVSSSANQGTRSPKSKPLIDRILTASRLKRRAPSIVTGAMLGNSAHKAGLSNGNLAGLQSPIVVLCDPEDPPLPLAPDDPTQIKVLATAAALASVPTFGSRTQRDAGLALAADATASLVQALGADTQLIDGAQLPPRSPAQAYFRVRTAALTGREAMRHAAALVQSAVTDLLETPLAGSDLVRELAGIRQVLLDLIARDDYVQRGQEGADHEVRAERTERTQEQRWLSRWIVGHQVHALFNVHAAIALRDAIRSLHEDQPHSACESLGRATTYVQGFAAARAHALALPGDFYMTTLRPTMLPPLMAVPLSGKMHFEYRLYRTRIDELLEELPQSIEALASSKPQLAFAREQLLEADLMEAERHVSLIEPLVGNAKSLIQPARSSENAITVLRRIRNERAARFGGLIRFGDQREATDC